MSAAMLCVEPKKAEKTDFIGPLKKFIEINYEEDPSSYDTAFNSLDMLRQQIRNPERHTTGVTALAKYYGQLVFLENKFPVNDNQVHLKFCWYDAFRTNKKLELHSLHYEKACVLFNIAALHTQVALTQKSASADGLKIAAHEFQCAAGAFGELRDTLYVYMNEVPTLDLSLESLTALAEVMLAQAQECVVEKATLDKMRNSILAKLCSRASELFNNSLEFVNNSVLKTQFDRVWPAQLEAKKHYYTALTHWYESLSAKADDSYGQEVARLRAASKFLGVAQKIRHSQAESLFDGFEGKLSRALAAAEKDNSIIYHEVVPDFSSLSIIAGAALAKPLPPNQIKDASIIGSDLFVSLVPFSTHQQVSAYMERLASFLREQSSHSEDATNVLNSTLASMHLPSSIDSLENPVALPATLIEKSNELREGGGLQALKEKLDTLDSTSQRDLEICNEIFRLLEEEEKNDKHMKERFKEKWVRTSSTSLTPTLYTEAQKYRTVLTKAMESDKIVRDKYENNRSSIATLCRGEEELSRIIPSAAAASLSPAALAIVEQLKALLERSSSLVKERSSILETLRAATTADHVTPEELSTAGESVAEIEAYLEKRKETFDTHAKRMDANIKSQEAMIDDITTANGQFVDLRESSDVNEKRENALANLDTAYNAFKELQNNLTEGTKFYNDLANLLLKFQSKISDFCFARDTELKEHLKELQRSVVENAVIPGPLPVRSTESPERDYVNRNEPNFGQQGQQQQLQRHDRPLPAPRRRQVSSGQPGGYGEHQAQESMYQSYGAPPQDYGNQGYAPPRQQYQGNYMPQQSYNQQQAYYQQQPPPPPHQQQQQPPQNPYYAPYQPYSTAPSPYNNQYNQ